MLEEAGTLELRQSQSLRVLAGVRDVMCLRVESVRAYNDLLIA